MLTGHSSVYTPMWCILKVVTNMMDYHRVPLRPRHNRSLPKHTAAWDVYGMMLNHHGMGFKPWNTSTEFLRAIACPRFLPATTVELGMLKNLIPLGVSSGRIYNGR